MGLSVEELLKPRRKLIADYIGNTQKIGYVFKTDIPSYYDKFPANFKKVEWWEERKPEDLPEYFKWNSLNDGTLYVVKLLEVNGDIFNAQQANGHIMGGVFNAPQDFPATLEEYQSQKQTPC